ncbi:TPA: hypothetical protein RG412_003261 [Acinetobacter baumannii]|nr:hypothetical protein [Acinetobacter baumannii]
MRKIFLTLTIILFSTFSNAYDQYLGYWQFKNTSEILKIYKNNENNYLVNIDIAKSIVMPDVGKTEYTLIKITKDTLGLKDGSTVIPLKLSNDGKALQLTDRTYLRVNENSAKTIVKNDVNCSKLRAKYQDEIGKMQINALINQIDNDKEINQLKIKYIRLQTNIQNCNIRIESN